MIFPCWIYLMPDRESGTEIAILYSSDPNEMALNQRPFAEALIDGTAQSAPDHIPYRLVVAARARR